MKHDRTDSLNLLKTAKGQIEAVIRMTEEDRYCVDIANQILAVEALLKKANLTILKQHLNTCVKESLENQSFPEKVDEIINILDKYMK
ncbi:MAG: metal-sensing transcriptional repressor [Candidatus Izemoplasmatales bacterium]|nr:metal-sensing transcriptional repressor [Candidatus Izemoplasmatales bacterium]MDY0139043.1 metal-sensing transcriptional repressor [Candidatus Izemoplasmatales bacterium]